MLAETPRYRCRLCGAMSYRRLTHRGPEGAMAYSGLYRCSGCSVTFADPAAWRESPKGSTSTSGVEESSASPPPTPSEHNFSFATWGGTPSLPDPSTFGYNEADVKAIKEAADRANNSKGRRRKCLNSALLQVSQLREA